MSPEAVKTMNHVKNYIEEHSTLIQRNRLNGELLLIAERVPNMSSAIKTASWDNMAISIGLSSAHLSISNID